MEFIIYEDWLFDTEVDINAFLDALAEAGVDTEGAFDDEGNHYWKFTATDDNHDNIPDFLAGIITEPVNMNVSQGGAWNN